MKVGDFAHAQSLGSLWTTKPLVVFNFSRCPLLLHTWETWSATATASSGTVIPRSSFVVAVAIHRGLLAHLGKGAPLLFAWLPSSSSTPGANFVGLPSSLF